MGNITNSSGIGLQSAAPSKENTMSGIPPSQQSAAPGSISVGGISGSKGIAIGHGASATVTEAGASADAIAEAFQPIVEKINTLPAGVAREDAEDAAKKLEAEARKGEQADESRVQRWFEFLAETSSDAWEVGVNTFVNPVAGVSSVFQKIAAKAKEEKAKKEAEK